MSYPIDFSERFELEIAQVKTLCTQYVEGFVSPVTDLAYGKRIDGVRGIQALEDPAQIVLRQVRGQYRPYGYGSGIEDLAYQNGMLVFALCDAGEATGEPYFGALARRIVGGLKRMSTLSPVEGFVPRGPHPDGKSYYPDSSLDQHSLYVCGLWRYFRSQFAADEDKKWIRETVRKILVRLERCNWSFQVEDGTTESRAGGSMLKLDATTVVLLFALLMVGYDITGEPKWKDAFEHFCLENESQRWRILARPIEREKQPKSPRWNMFHNQDVLRTETLRRLIANEEQRNMLQRRMENMVEDMLTTSYFRDWKWVWVASETWDPGSDLAANVYLKPLGLTVQDHLTVMDLWAKFDQSVLSPETLPGIRNHYEPLTLATPAMVWQGALLTGKSELVQQVRPAVRDMVVKVDFSNIDLGWAYNYAVLAGLWSLAAPQFNQT